MKLAEYEAETICNLEKENFKLIDTLNSVEENLLNEKEKNTQLTAIHEVKNTCFSRSINIFSPTGGEKRASHGTNWFGQPDSRAPAGPGATGTDQQHPSDTPE